MVTFWSSQQDHQADNCPDDSDSERDSRGLLAEIVRDAERGCEYKARQKYGETYSQGSLDHFLHSFSYGSYTLLLGWCFYERTWEHKREKPTADLIGQDFASST